MIRKLLAAVFTVVLLTGMAAAQELASKETVVVSSESVPVFSWEKTSYNFGKIPQGKPVTVTYSFTNTGKAPLTITNVRPTCGCTTDDYSKEPIAPGKKGFVKLTYNAANAGTFNKSATITANTTPGTVALLFSGEVIPNNTASK